ncbi:MAG: serine/threonine protein kinase [Bryobacterales bacterium]|nr:serine/threonine protein kinase [Bryobacterales bacterium]
MDAERWERIQTLFHQAEALPAGERRVFLETAAGGAADIVEDVLSLLDESGAGDSILNEDLGQLAQGLIEDSSGLTSARIGQYRILGLIGQGGMGMVYLAERSDLGNRVAIKVLPNAWMSRARRARFAAETRTLARLNHPSIARLYDAGALDDGTPWFAMEYVQGVPLNTYCEQHKLPLKERLALFRPACEAVQFAHSQAVLHRDLKPSNILVREDGGVRLLDFGIAKQLDQFDEAEEATRTGLRLATPAYAAPEQLRGEPPAVQGDVYSLGVILYELLTGERPFEKSAEQLEAAVEAARPSTRGRGRVSANRAEWADLDILCLAALHPEPGRRYRSVEAFIRDIDHFLQTEPLEARPDDYWYRARKFAVRRWKALSAAAALLLLFGGMAAYFTFRLALARDAARAEEARTRRVQQFMLRLFQGDDPNSGPAEGLRVITLVDRSAREARALRSDPAVQADLYQTLGAVYEQLGKFDRADELMREALQIRRTLPVPDDARVTESLVALGMLRSGQGRLAEAETFVREGLTLASEKLPAADPAAARATSALGRVLLERGQYASAIEILEKALRDQPLFAQPSQEQATVLLGIAGAQFYLSHYKESEEINRRVIGLYTRLYGDRHPQLADPLINLGSIAQDTGRFADAERYYRQAYDIYKEYYGASHPEVAASLRGIGRALVSQKRYDEAERMLRQVLAVREESYGPDHPYIASTLSDLGNVAVQRGNLDSAEKQYSRMAAIYRKLYGDCHQFVGVAESNIASVYLRRKDYAHAERLFRQVSACYVRILPADHPNAALTRAKLGRTLLREGRYQEAQQESAAALKILETKMDPAAPDLAQIRKDLSEIATALKRNAGGSAPKR